MDDITIIEGDDLDTLLAALDTGAADIYRLRVWPAGNGSIRVKVNERMWTPPLGGRE